MSKLDLEVCVLDGKGFFVHKLGKEMSIKSNNNEQF